MPIRSSTRSRADSATRAVASRFRIRVATCPSWLSTASGARRAFCNSSATDLARAGPSLATAPTIAVTSPSFRVAARARSRISASSTSWGFMASTHSSAPSASWPVDSSKRRAGSANTSKERAIRCSSPDDASMSRSRSAPLITASALASSRSRSRRPGSAGSSIAPASSRRMAPRGSGHASAAARSSAAGRSPSAWSTARRRSSFVLKVRLNSQADSLSTHVAVCTLRPSRPVFRTS